MAFTWKDNGKIFVGEGGYHLTFVVMNRTPLLGRLVPLAQCVRKDVRRKTELADVEYTPLGLRIHHKVEELEQRHPVRRPSGSTSREVPITGLVVKAGCI